MTGSDPDMLRLEADLQIVNARLGASREMIGLMIADLRELTIEALRIEQALIRIEERRP